MTNTPTDNLTSDTTGGHHIYCGSLHPDNAECTCPMGRKATDTSVQKLHKSPDDNKTQIAQDDELVEAYGQLCRIIKGQVRFQFSPVTGIPLRVDVESLASRILPLLASREAAVLERAAKVAEGFQKLHRGGLDKRGYSPMNALARRIASRIRTLSKGETP